MCRSSKITLDLIASQVIITKRASPANMGINPSMERKVASMNTKSGATKKAISARQYNDVLDSELIFFWYSVPVIIAFALNDFT